MKTTLTRAVTIALITLAAALLGRAYIVAVSYTHLTLPTNREV